MGGARGAGRTGDYARAGPLALGWGVAKGAAARWRHPAAGIRTWCESYGSGGRDGLEWAGRGERTRAIAACAAPALVGVCPRP